MANAPTVLLVEDSPTQAERTRLILEEAGYAVRVESSGLDALAALKKESAHVVLSDIILPGMDGYTRARSPSPRTRKARSFMACPERQSSWAGHAMSCRLTRSWSFSTAARGRGGKCRWK